MASGTVYQRVYVYKRAGDTWSSTYNDLTLKASDVQVKKGIQNIKDTFSFRLNKAHTFFTGVIPDIDYGDLVKIWMKRDSYTFLDADLLMEGVVDSTPMKIDTTGRILEVKGNDFFETCFDVQVPVSGYEGTEKTWREILIGLMNRWEFQSRNLYWDSTNPTTKTDSSSFPKLNIALNYTPFYQIVEKLTSNESTGDGQYIYYITSSGGNRYLTIRAKTETVSLGTFTEGILTESIDVDKNKDDVKNFVVYNAGNDLAGNPIEYVEYDPSSIGKLGYKYYYMIEETADVSTTIMQEEVKLNGGANFNWSAGKWTSESHYPTAYNYVWNQKLASATVTSISATDFDDDLRDLSLQSAKIVARRLIDESKTPKYSTKENFKFRNDFVLGGLYDVVIPDRNLNRKLRITEATYALTGTDITFEEDSHRASL